MEVMPYTAGFRRQMVRRMLGPAAVTATALAKTTGVPQPTLSKWLREAGTVGAMGSAPKAKEGTAPGRKWTAAEKLRVVVEAEGLAGPSLGELLRREGVHEEQLRTWRDAAAGALTSAEAAPSERLTSGQRKRLAGAEKRVKELERELRRKEKALAEAAALLMLEKKLQALGWDEKYPRRGKDGDGESTEGGEK